MDSLPIITGIITSVLGAGAIAFGVTTWLMKRLIVRQDGKLDQIIEKLDSLRDELYKKYVTKSEFNERFVTLKQDLQREIELVSRVVQARARGPQDDGGA